MRASVIGAAAAVLAGSVLAGGVAQAAPLEVYGRLPAMDLVSLSPNGTRIAFVQPLNGRSAVVVDQLSPPAVVASLPPSEQKVQALIWADAAHLLVVKSPVTAGAPDNPANPLYILQTLDLDKRKVATLFNHTQDDAEQTRIKATVRMNTVSELPRVVTANGRVAVFARGLLVKDGAGAPALMSTDLAGDKEQILDSAPAKDPGRRWILDDAGAPIAQTALDPTSHTWVLRVKQGARWVDAYSAKSLFGGPEVLGFSRDGAAVLIKAAKEGGATQVLPVALADGKVGAPLADYDGFASLIRDPATWRVIGGVKIGMEPTYAFFDPKDAAAWDTVVKTFPDEQAEPVSWSQDHGKVVVRVTGVRRGIVYAIVDLASRKATEIGPAYQGITADDLADVHLATYPAKDGLPIRAFLTLPVGREPKNLPLVVLAHDGPADHDQAGFHWMAQALASRGYAVLQPQFRGSSGFDSALAAAGLGEFGRKMQSDLSDGVRALAAKGYIDPKRVCIVGSGYGGYAALAGATLEEGVYRCAVAVAGASDLRKLIGNRAAADPFHPSFAPLWEPYVAAKGASDPVFDQVSPARHAAQASGPILLIHGHDDPIVPFDQSQAMEAALKQANKPVELVTLSSEDHALAKEATRQHVLQATVAFLEKNNPAR